MADQAVLALDDVKVNGRRARVYAFRDRLELVDGNGVHPLPLTDVARITTKTGLRRGQVTVIRTDGEEFVISHLRARDTPVAFRVLVTLAEEANR